MTKKTTTLKRASRLIRSAHSPLLICHVAPDGDALGSLMGLAHALQRMGHRPIAACSEAVPHHFDFIPGVKGIVQEVGDPFDLVVSLDCSDLERLGHFPEMLHFGRCPLVNIDHHVTNVNFGDVNLVDPGASSTAEVVLRLLDAMDVPLDAELATCLLAGIVTDTRGFRTSNVTSRVMEAALRLMEAGASLPHITRHGLDRRPTVALRLWGAALSHLRHENGLVWTSIPLTMRRAVGYNGNGDAGLASLLISANGADVSAVFTECDDGRVEVGLRAAPGFDVTQVALRFGGGGHALAAGCDLPGPMVEARIKVLNALRLDVARQRQSHAQRNSQPR